MRKAEDYATAGRFTRAPILTSGGAVERFTRTLSLVLEAAISTFAATHGGYRVFATKEMGDALFSLAGLLRYASLASCPPVGHCRRGERLRPFRDGL